MDKTEKEFFKNEIIQKVGELKQKVAELVDLTQPIEPDCAIGRISRMDAINNKSVNDAALRKNKSQLKALEKALLDINKPEFGKCIICRRAIPKGRLLIMPESKKCVICASR